MPAGLVPINVRQIILREIRSGVVTADVGGKKLGKRWAPGYLPYLWNNDPNTRLKNNCYNYATIKTTNTFAQPGKGSGRMYSQLSGPDVLAAAKRDGLVDFYIPSNRVAQAPRGVWHVVALVVAPGWSGAKLEGGGDQGATSFPVCLLFPPLGARREEERPWERGWR